MSIEQVDLWYRGCCCIQFFLFESNATAWWNSTFKDIRIQSQHYRHEQKVPYISISLTESLVVFCSSESKLHNIGLHTYYQLQNQEISSMYTINRFIRISF